jgi:maltokinase
VTTKDEWGVLVGAADASLVLPVRPRGAVVEVPGPLHAVAILELGLDHAVSVIQDGAGNRWVAPLTRTADGISRAVPGDGCATALIRQLAGDDPASNFKKFHQYSEDVTGERAITVDQTNDSVIVGERAVVKWTVRAGALGEPGSPAANRIQTLARADFEYMPLPWGTVEFLDEDTTTLIATVTSYLADAQDGWDWAVEALSTYATGATDDMPLTSVSRVAAIAAHMHDALGKSGVDFATTDLVASWRTRALAELGDALSSLDGAELTRLKSRAPRIQRAIDSLGSCATTPLIDIHGDFHIGQILRYGAPPVYAVTDFDGSPVLSPRERISKQPAAVDIVSMLASLDHVGRVVMKRVEGADAKRVRSWTTASQQMFLDTYRESLGPARYDELIDESLFEPLRLQHELREYIYAARHLPHWKYVPDMALQDLLPDEE